jgi:hypothetical protein
MTLSTFFTNEPKYTTKNRVIRNLLMFVDGFNFTVGIMVVALNEHWQRVGDMAALTVVVDTREP